MEYIITSMPTYPSLLDIVNITRTLRTSKNTSFIIYYIGARRTLFLVRSTPQIDRISPRGAKSLAGLNYIFSERTLLLMVSGGRFISRAIIHRPGLMCLYLQLLNGAAPSVTLHPPPRRRVTR